MAAARIAEPIDILEYSPFGLTACVPPIAPNHLGFALHGRVLRSNVPRVMDLKNVSTMQCLTGDLQSKSAERGIVVTIALATHPLPGSGLLANHERGDLEAVLFQALLIRVGTLLGGFNRSSQRLVCCLYFISRRLPMPLRVFSIRAFCEVGC